MMATLLVTLVYVASSVKTRRVTVEQVIAWDPWSNLCRSRYQKVVGRICTIWWRVIGAVSIVRFA